MKTSFKKEWKNSFRWTYVALTISLLWDYSNSIGNLHRFSSLLLKIHLHPTMPVVDT